MAYATPHHVRDYLRAACLRICHDYVIRCQRRANSDKRNLLCSTREIDLCGQLADFFGPVAHLAAQGAAPGESIDLEVEGPTIRAEVKYFRPPAQNWASLKDDWDWLLNGSNTGDEFKKRAWVVFWPSTSTDMFKFTNCLSVPKSHNDRYCLEDFAPFSPYAHAEMPANGNNQRLAFKDQIDQSSLIFLQEGKRVRCDIIGSHHHPLWAAIYTRVAPVDVNRLNGLAKIHITTDPITVQSDIL